MDRLSKSDAILIHLLLMDPIISSQFIDAKNKEVYSIVTINKENGEITFGKSKFRWLNHLIADEKKISFIDFAIKTVAALSGQKNNYNKKMLSALSEEVIKNAVMNGNYHYVVDMLFDSSRYGRPDSNTESSFHAEQTVRTRGKTYIAKTNSGEILGEVNFLFKN